MGAHHHERQLSFGRISTRGDAPSKLFSDDVKSGPRPGHGDTVGDTNDNVSGSIDGTHFTLVFDQGLGQHLNRTGTIDAGVLTLSWMDNGQLQNEKFALKSDAEYGQTLDKFKNGSMQLQKADEERIALGKRAMRPLR